VIQKRAGAIAQRILEARTEPPDWKHQVRIRRLSVEAWTRYAAGRREPALEKMAEAASLEAATDRSPSRFRALYGAGMASEKAGLNDEATEHYRRLLEITGKANAMRLELEHAAAFVGNS
jgi:hypothetical protein